MFKKHIFIFHKCDTENLKEKYSTYNKCLSLPLQTVSQDCVKE